LLPEAPSKPVRSSLGGQLGGQLTQTSFSDADGAGGGGGGGLSLAVWILLVVAGAGVGMAAYLFGIVSPEARGRALKEQSLAPLFSTDGSSSDGDEDEEGVDGTDSSRPLMAGQ